jgi:hypothetical protein
MVFCIITILVVRLRLRAVHRALDFPRRGAAAFTVASTASTLYVAANAAAATTAATATTSAAAKAKATVAKAKASTLLLCPGEKPRRSSTRDIGAAMFLCPPPLPGSSEHNHLVANDAFGGL